MTFHFSSKFLLIFNRGFFKIYFYINHYYFFKYICEIFCLYSLTQWDWFWGSEQGSLVYSLTHECPSSLQLSFAKHYIFTPDPISTYLLHVFTWICTSWSKLYLFSILPSSSQPYCEKKEFLHPLYFIWRCLSQSCNHHVNLGGNMLTNIWLMVGERWLEVVVGNSHYSATLNRR